MAKKPNTMRLIDKNYRVSVPPEVRKALKVDKQDYVLWDIRGNSVTVRKARLVVD